MILKLDLEKAYDRLEWSFIDETLRMLNLPYNICSILYHCISTVSVSINWNGENSQSFHSSRGIRQGDPISPYLFIPALERLSHRINDLVNLGVWKGFKFGRGEGPTLSHICFADDLVFVAEANMNKAQMILNVLEEFGSSSGQKVNISKFKVFFSSNIDLDLASDLSRTLGIEKTQDLGNYLGAPLLHQRTTRNTYAYVLEKMRKKLSVWKANTLSFAGRVTLAPSSLESMPGYLVQTSVIPISVCDEAEKICRDFIWGSTVEKRKCHLVSWEKVCKPKEAGGLGFRNMKTLNQAYILKLAWQLINERDKLWVQIMRAKYQCGSLHLPKVSMKSNSSRLWNAISKNWKPIEDNIQWSVRSGQDTKFWLDRWLPDCHSLSHYMLDSIPETEKNFKVAYYADRNGWRWNAIQHLVPEFLCEKIELIQSPSPNQSDFVSWIPEPNGLFSIKSAYAIQTVIRKYIILFLRRLPNGKVQLESDLTCGS